ncbi:MAG: glycolate oxidase subunit GlcF [Rhodocyclaceae bacterium]|nr:glycolate oxidase subunit GlcF [Rhodocyclaceae bacterium]
MQTELADFIRDTPAGREAEEILRKCVHCGFCTATCPTYQLLGDELDGPRGRIYLIKQMLEGGAATEKTRLHLDRCLTCRACETTCPSGVHYSRLLDIGRAVVETRAPRHGMDALMRSTLKHFLPRPRLFNPAMRLGQALRPLLPAALRAKVPAVRDAGAWPAPRHSRKMVVLAGCVQPAMAPGINAAAARVLDRIGISLHVAPRAGCCGALRFHLNDVEAARDDARRNIDVWWPLLEDGCEAVVMTASGCGVQVRDYAHLLQEDARYAVKAARVALLTRDIGEVVAAEGASLAPLLAEADAQRPRTKLAFHAPCTLQHGLKIRGTVEALLGAVFDLVPVADAHLCCGSAGTYSVLQPEISTRLRDNKLAALGAAQRPAGSPLGGPLGIASANIGCITHLQSGTQLPVRHWIEYIDERLNT